METSSVAATYSICAGTQVRTAILGRVLYQFAAMAIAIFAIGRDVQEPSLMWASILALLMFFMLSQSWYARKVRKGRTADEKNQVLKAYYQFSSRFTVTTLLVVLMLRRSAY